MAGSGLDDKLAWMVKDGLNTIKVIGQIQKGAFPAKIPHR